MMAKFSWLDQPEGRMHGCMTQCLNNLIVLGENNLRKFIKEYTEHYHFERNHQGIENEIIESNNEILKHSQSSKDPILKKENEATMAKFRWFGQPIQLKTTWASTGMYEATTWWPTKLLLSTARITFKKSDFPTIRILRTDTKILI